MRTHPDINFFSGDSTFAKSNQDSAEADTFFCFVELLSGFRGNFVQQLDNSVVGIRATITRLSQMLKDHDEELCRRHLELTTKVLNLKEVLKEQNWDSWCFPILHNKQYKFPGLNS